ncbi:MAG TPA: hypothetical protein DCY27_05920 [Desulfobacterales bacterium]|nr:hypothetical protein [Desulfobacterales bacterium]
MQQACVSIRSNIAVGQNDTSGLPLLRIQGSR